jgi:outer membrane protein assembly factor BamB
LPSLTLRGTSRARLAGDKILVAFASGMLAALNIKTGEAVWETAVATPGGRNDLERIIDSDGEFVVDKGVIYIATFQGRVAAINLQDGATVWARDMSSYAGLTVNDSQVLVSDAESHLWALDRGSGATLWRQDKLVGRDISAPVLMDGMVVVGDRGGYVHWLSADDGHFLARARLEYAYGQRGPTWWIMSYPTTAPRDPVVTATPVAGERALYVHDDAGALTMYRVPATATP